ncbi:dynamin family protein [Oceanobacillus salinisoli]|uniref:dynamin family protein n=1 Tax=Oceanobacillus salinisoli TaxID=2678611 RepID=UPI0012E1A287|nr:dynamin family protein [Oceanobacillus salinisoli]
MSFSLEGYQVKRNALIDKLDSLSLLLEEMDNEVEKKQVEHIKKELLTNTFQVAVVGEFSRGKSTFINALLGEKVLPSSVKPTTALLNIIEYSEEPTIKLHFHKGNQVKEVTEQVFTKLVAPKDPIEGDTQSEKEYEKHVELLSSIKYAEIGRPLSFCSNGVTIIDTPGTNDLDPIREQITNSIIPRSDSAILILSAVKILSESEISFLRDRLLASDIQKVFIVINFKDDLGGPEDEQKVLNYAYAHLKDILADPKIFLVTAKQALNARRKEAGEELVGRRGRPIKVWDIQDTGFHELETQLADFLANDRGRIKLQKPITRTMKLMEQTVTKQLTMQKQSLENEMDDLQEKIEAFRPKLDQMNKLGMEAQNKLSLELLKQHEQLKKWYQQELNGISAAGLDTFNENRHLSVEQISRLVEDTIAPLEKQLHIDKKEKISNAVKMSMEMVSKQVNEEWFKMEDEFDSMLKPDSHSPSTIHYETDDGLSIFDDILDDLDMAWERSNSFLGKLAIGAGAVATIVIGGITALFKSGWAWLTGEDEKSKFKSNLIKQFDDSKRQRLNSFDKEYKAIKEAVLSQYKETIDSHVRQMEKQLQTLMKHAEMEEMDVQKELEIIHRYEWRLEQIRTEITTINQSLATNADAKVG